MKKVLALVLAVIMVCTMAFAVAIKPGDPAQPGSTTGKVAVIENIKPGETVMVELKNAEDTEVDYYVKDGKFVPANNVVNVTFAKGAEYVQSQGWVKTGTGDAASDYQYQITFKQDLTKITDADNAEIQISAITFKATGYTLVTLHKATKVEENLGYSFGYEKHEMNVVEADGSSFNPVGGQVNVVSSLSDKNGKEVNSLEVKTNGMTYTLTKGMKLYALDTAVTFDTTKDKGYTGLNDFSTPISNTLNLAAKAEVALADKANTTYKVYAKGTDGKVLSVAATNNDGVLSFTVPAMSTVVITKDTLTTTGTTGTNTNGTTTNPGTGANDIVGVAAALAVVALVSGAAISLKK